jgi:hypothetical protein
MFTGEGYATIDGRHAYLDLTFGAAADYRAA